MRFLVLVENDRNPDNPYWLTWQDAIDNPWEALEPLLADGSIQPGDKTYICPAEHVREYTAEAKTVAVETAALNQKEGRG